MLPGLGAPHLSLQASRQGAQARRARRKTQNWAAPRPAQAPFARGRLPGWALFRRRGIAETHGLRRLWDATTPNPLRKRRGLDVLGTGDRGWRPDGLTPGYCLKPFQGFEDGLGKGRGSPELMTSCEVFEGLDGGWDISSQRVLVSKAWEAWRRDVSTAEVIEGLDWGWDVSSQTVLVSKAWECGDETSPPPKSLTVWMGAGTSRPRKFWVRGGQLATRGRHPAGG